MSVWTARFEVHSVCLTLHRIITSLSVESSFSIKYFIKPYKTIIWLG
jgi:hypothetical protein